MAQNIVIYQDEGVGAFSLSCLKSFFKDDAVTFADANAVCQGLVFKKGDVFIMPGGADLPYCKKLNGAGNTNIRQFVEDGGTYLGICAGAYYACRAIEFHKGRADEICGPRELAFVDAVAYGSLPEIAPHYDDTLKSAGITTIVREDGQTIPTYYHGGCAFRMGGDDTQILARYAGVDDAPPAVIARKFGAGRVILSGAHLEVTPEVILKHPEQSPRAKDLYEDYVSKPNHQPDFLKDILTS